MRRASRGSPVAYQGTVYVPVSGWEENRASDLAIMNAARCAGSVVALRIRDGARVWKTYLVGRRS